MFYKQGKSAEASEALTEAWRIFLDIGRTADAADCSRILDDMVTSKCKKWYFLTWWRRKTPSSGHAT
jgi:hypothetical protein